MGTRGKDSQKRRHRERDQKWRDRRQVARAFFDEKEAQRRALALQVPPGEDDGTVR